MYSCCTIYSTQYVCENVRSPWLVFASVVNPCLHSETTTVQLYRPYRTGTTGTGSTSTVIKVSLIVPYGTGTYDVVRMRQLDKHSNILRCITEPSRSRAAHRHPPLSCTPRRRASSYQATAGRTQALVFVSLCHESSYSY